MRLQVEDVDDPSPRVSLELLELEDDEDDPPSFVVSPVVVVVAMSVIIGDEAASAASSAANWAASCTSRSKSGLAFFIACQHNCLATANAFRSCWAEANNSRRKYT